MKNKNAFLLAEETVKIIIAVIAISFLAYFLISLYLTNKTEKDLKFAEASLEHLIEEINAEVPEVEIYNPEEWDLVSWPYGKILPVSCKNMGWENCLCICNALNIGDYAISLIPSISVYQKTSDKCDKSGFCLEVQDEFIVRGENGKQRPINIKSPLKLNIDYETKIISKA